MRVIDSPIRSIGPLNRVLGILRPALIIVWKDILLEKRTKDILSSSVIFAILLIVVFNIALDVSFQIGNAMAPGILWVSFSFAGVLTMNRMLSLEKDGGSLDGLVIMPVSRDSIYMGKMLSMLLFMSVVQAILLPVFAVVFNFSVISIGLISAMFLATVGYAAVGTLFAAITVQTRSRESLLPILFFPVVVPVIIGGVKASTSAIDGSPFSDVARWLQLIAVFDLVFLVVCPWVFHFVLEE